MSLITPQYNEGGRRRDAAPKILYVLSSLSACFGAIKNAALSTVCHTGGSTMIPGRPGVSIN